MKQFLDRLICFANNRQGFTLIEMLVSIGIVAIISVTMSTGIFQLMNISTTNIDTESAIRSLDIAGNWFVRDFQSADADALPESVYLDNKTSGDNITLLQSVASSNDTTVIYTISADGKLLRKVNSNAPSLIASDISSINYETGSNTATNKVTITSTVGQDSVTRSFNVLARIAKLGLAVINTSLPDGTVGNSYTQVLQAGGGTAPYTWTYSLGSLPDGLSLDAVTGIISGTPTSADTFNFTVQAQDHTGATTTRRLTITINSASNFIVSGYPATTAGTSHNFTVTAKNGSSTATGYTGTVHFTSSDIQAVLPGNYTFTSSDHGTKTFSATLNTAGTQSITATDTNSITGTQSGIEVTAGAASKLAFVQQPSNTLAAASISPAVTVAVQDASGNTVTTSSASITVAISTNPSSGTLSGTKTINAANGMATFNNLSIDKAGSGYTLRATSSPLTQATSLTFNITLRLAFTIQPSNATAALSISPAVKVAVQDAGGNTVTSSSASITVAIGTNPSSGTLAGTKTVNAVSGVATFSSLSIDKTGTGYTLSASSTGLSGATSSAFNITAGTAVKLGFTSQPGGAYKGTTFTQQPIVAVQDVGGNTVLSYSGNVTIAIGTNPAAGILSGTTSISISNGVATFTNLSIDKAGTGYTLTATCSSLSQSTSALFNVNYPAPTLSSINPTSASRGSTLSVILTGTNFISGVSSVSVGTTNITLNSTTVNNSTQITINITLAGGGSAKGTYDFSVTNSGPGGGTSGTQSFTITN